MTTRWFLNADATRFTADTGPSRAPLELHRKLPGYDPTPLLPAPVVAERLGIAEVWVKDESSRLGLPAFKTLGASWASFRAVEDRLGEEIGPWRDPSELSERLAKLQPMSLAAATDGNHGRAVAKMARLLGFGAHIFVPAGTVEPRIAAIEREGATVTVVDGTYDDAVARSAEEAGDDCLVISDTSWPGYEDVPRWVIDGYSTVLWEVDDELSRRGLAQPDVVAVQIGVGALAASVVRHYRRPELELADRPRLLGVEPTVAACVLASMEAGGIVTIPGPQDSIMAGLNCGTPSLIAWPLVSNGIDVFVAAPDERAREGMRLLAEAGIVSGESGAAGLAGLLELSSDDSAAPALELLGLGPSSRLLLLSTEGATDPEAYLEIVGRPPEAVAGHAAGGGNG
jgi:diaminopropionate ammonia-lyase